MLKPIFWSLLWLLPLQGIAQTFELLPLTSRENTSIRGVSVVNDQVVWVSGSRGYVGKSLDAGRTWQWLQPKGYETLDFRDIQGFDKEKAIIVNAGTPAYILSTKDGGQTWKEVYKNTDTAIFLNGMDFWDAQQGIVFGDPIDHRMQLLRTADGGATWQDISSKLQQPMHMGEAGFAASGTAIKALPGGKVWVATGGAVSNIYYSKDFGNHWQVYKCPIVQGESSTGVFSIDFYDAKNGIAVGGNYLKDKDNSNNVLYTKNGGRTWKKPTQPVGGYRSSVVYLSANICVATGTSGTDISKDGGKRWHNISPLSFNAIGATQQLVILASGKGQIYQLKVKP